MNVLFITSDYEGGSYMHRAILPSVWIDKFSDHSSKYISAQHSSLQSFRHLLGWADVIVLHKQDDYKLQWARMGKEAGKVVVWDTDDYDPACFGKYYVQHYLSSSLYNIDEMLSLVDGVICASRPLADRTPHENVRVIPNGFDITLPSNMVTPKSYFSGPEGDAFKVAWGGSISHDRDFEMFLKLGVIEEINEELPVDWYFYGLTEFEGKRGVGKGTVYFKGGTNIDQYLNRLYSDATVLIAPLVKDEFNDCRSTLKLVEAGMAGKTIVASNVETYKKYEGRDGVFLVENTVDRWSSALRELIVHKGLRVKQEERNRNAAYRHYTAETLTDQRITFFQQLIKAR